MEIEVQASKKLEDGQHKGVVVAVEYRDEPYKYTDLVIEESETKFRLKYGSPTVITPDSKLGKLLAKFTQVKEGDKLDPDKILIGKVVTFLTMREKTDKGEFVRIVDNSIKPAENTEAKEETVEEEVVA